MRALVYTSSGILAEQALMHMTCHCPLSTHLFKRANCHPGNTSSTCRFGRLAANCPGPIQGYQFQSVYMVLPDVSVGHPFWNSSGKSQLIHVPLLASRESQHGIGRGEVTTRLSLRPRSRACIGSSDDRPARGAGAEILTRVQT